MTIHNLICVERLIDLLASAEHFSIGSRYAVPALYQPQLQQSFTDR